MALAVGIAGCGVPSGGAGTTPPGTTARAGARAGAASSRSRALVAQADRTHEYPTPVHGQSVVGGWRSSEQAVEVFAHTYINWTAATVSVRLTALAEVSIGQARSAMLLGASETAKDYELRRSEVANSGTVEAVAPLPGAPHTYIVVTRERTTSMTGSVYRGLAPAWHVTLATVARVSDGLWVPSGWQPQS